jgi:hypothetical protein
MGAIDDLIDDYDPEQEEVDLVQHLEKYWSRGKHKDQTGKVWKIIEMITSGQDGKIVFIHLKDSKYPTK